ncbi:MAG: hypothetical protein QX195_04515 [Methylococcaceae bacterium]|jgi:hypothetical protein
MKIITIAKSALFIAMLINNAMVFAYGAQESEAACKKPRFTDFNLATYSAPENSEVAPESEFFFKLSPWVDPSTIKLTAKDKPLNFTVESNSSFHKVKGKLPAEFNGLFVRLNASAKAVLGCDEQSGWLVKVAKP